MATAGYDPRASLDLWELMKCVEEDAVSLGKSVNAENKFGFLRTHPTSDDRLEALEKDMPGAMRLWRDHPSEEAKAKIRQQQIRSQDEAGRTVDTVRGQDAVAGTKEKGPQADEIMDGKQPTEAGSTYTREAPVGTPEITGTADDVRQV
jgi:predicted Zn-dependent protease